MLCGRESAFHHYIQIFLLPLWSFFAISDKFLHSAVFYFSRFSFLLWKDAAFLSLSYFLQLWTAQDCARPWAVFLLSCPLLWSVPTAAVAKLCDKSHFLLLFQLWKILLLISQSLQLMTITALFRIPPAGLHSLTPGWDWTQGQSSTTWSNGKSALGGTGGWTSWGPYNLNYCLVPNIASFPRYSLKRCIRLPKDVRSISFPIWISVFYFASQRIHT